MPRGFRFPGAALLLGGALFVAGGCSAVLATGVYDGTAAPDATHVIPGVPFLPQEEDTCGPSSLAMLLRFHGFSVETRELVVETRTKGIQGTLITDLAAASRRRGLAVEVTTLDLPRLRREIASGEPVILLVDLGAWVWSRPHYLLVYGATPEGVVAHSGRTEGAVIPYGTLDAQWAKMGRLAIVVTAGRNAR